MRFRAAAALICLVLCAPLLTGGAQARAAASEKPRASEGPAGRKDDRVYIDGVGGAHGFGLAMDGVEGQARNGWGHEKILSLFYDGTQTAHFGGTIRVWLAEG